MSQSLLVHLTTLLVCFQTQVIHYKSRDLSHFLHSSIIILHCLQVAEPAPSKWHSQAIRKPIINENGIWYLCIGIWTTCAFSRMLAFFIGSRTFSDRLAQPRGVRRGSCLFLARLSPRTAELKEFIKEKWIYSPVVGRVIVLREGLLLCFCWQRQGMLREASRWGNIMWLLSITCLPVIHQICTSVTQLDKRHDAGSAVASLAYQKDNLSIH